MASSKNINKVGSVCYDGIEYNDIVRFKSREPDDIVKEFLHKLTEQFTLEAARRMYITEQATMILNRELILPVLTQALARVSHTFLVKPDFGGNHIQIPRMAYCGLEPDVDY